MYFDDIKKGYKFPGTSITVTETHIVNYAGISGDFNRFHMNESFMKQFRWGKRIAHGMLTASLVVPSVAPIVGNEALSHLSDSFTYRNPVFIGDTIATECEVLELVPKQKAGVVKIGFLTKNDRGEVVMEGETVLLMAYRPK